MSTELLAKRKLVVDRMNVEKKQVQDSINRQLNILNQQLAFYGKMKDDLKTQHEKIVNEIRIGKWDEKLDEILEASEKSPTGSPSPGIVTDGNPPSSIIAPN